MASLRTFLRRARTLFWTAFSIVVILAAVGVGVGKLLMPYSDRYQPRLEAWLSEEFGRPVKLDSFSGDWTAFGPRLTLQGLKLLPPEGESDDGAEQDASVAIEAAALDLRPLNALVPGLPHYNFRIIGADLELRHTVDGRLELSGFGVTGRAGDSQGSALGELARVGEVILQDSHLVYQDEKHGVLLGFSSIQGSLNLEGDRLAAKIRASFHEPRSGMVFGDVDATLLLTLDDEQKLVSADWQASADELMLAAFQGRLPQNPFLPLTGWLNAEAWGRWSRQDGHRVTGEAMLSDARLVNDYQDLRLDRVETRFRWNRLSRGEWELHLADLLYDDGVEPWAAPRISMARNVEAGLGLWISADELPLGVPLNLARDVMSIYGTAWPAFLPRAAAGRVRDLDLALDDSWRLKLARGAVAEASVRDWDRWPSLSGLDGEVSLQQGSGRILLSGPRMTADWPRMFREPLAFEMTSCVVDLRWGGEWQVGFSGCALQNEDLAAQADVVISQDEGKPRVDVNAAVTRADIARLGPYWPEAILKDNVKSWLRNGLREGLIRQGRFQINGDMDDWPFRHGRGRFEAVADVVDAAIDYYPGWPVARGVDATAHFVGASLAIEGRVAEIGGVPVASVQSGIRDMKSPLLTVAWDSRATLPAYLDFLERTPLSEQVDADLDRFEFAGAAVTRGRLAVPLGQAPGELTVDGVMNLSAGRFSDPALDITLDEIAGALNYNQDGFRGEDLAADYRGQAARLDIRAGAGEPERFRADLSGVFDVRDIIPAFLLESYEELTRVNGDCYWETSIVTAPAADGSGNETLLTIDSQLAGVALELPAPLSKPAGEAWPLQLRFPLSGESRVLDLALADRAVLRFDLPPNLESPRRASIGLGAAVPELPPEGFIRIGGGSRELDLDGWIGVVVEGARKGRGLGGLELEEGRLHTTSLMFLDRRFDDVAMDFDVQDADIRAVFSAGDIDGKVRYTTRESGISSLSAEFERLALGDPQSTGFDMETDPADLPSLHLYARSFRYAGVELGETRIEAFPTQDGFHFEKVDTASDQLAVQATGDWSLEESGQRSDFNIHMVSESLGDFLQSLDISSSFQGGQTVVDFAAWWQGSPATFALSRLNGEISFSVVDGNITNASSGTGRLLGLLSIQALPRRLSLDFRDVFDAGFSFEEAKGTFIMENGTARTDDVLLRSSAANISVIGQTDLVKQQYDQLLTIRPGLGNTLPIIGALAAGPGGAAAGLALQGLLHEQIGEATQVQYTITGDWDDPQFEAVDVKPAEKEPEKEPDKEMEIND